MVRVAKSLQAPEQGYPHRDHRTPKRHRLSRVQRLKNKRFKQKIEERNRLELEKQEAREKTIKDINAKREVLDSQIDEEVKKAEEEIKVLKEAAPDKINKILLDCKFPHLYTVRS